MIVLNKYLQGNIWRGHLHHVDQDDEPRVTYPVPLWPRAARATSSGSDLALPLHCPAPTRTRLHPSMSDKYKLVSCCYWTLIYLLCCL